jgi:hypothetical protein
MPFVDLGGCRSLTSGAGGAARRATFIPRRVSRSAVTSPQARRYAETLTALRLEPVSIDSRTGLCRHREFLPGKGSARPETGRAFLARTACSARQRLAFPASPSPKAREVKDNSAPGRKPDLRRTAWWGWQDSNLQPSDYSKPPSHSWLNADHDGRVRSSRPSETNACVATPGDGVHQASASPDPGPAATS